MRDSNAATYLIDKLTDMNYIIADKGYDSELVRD